MTATAQLSTTLNRPGARLQRRCLALSLLSTLSVGIAQAQPISNIYTFGDSDNDVGILGDHYTNLGDMWIESLSHKIGLSSTPARLPDDLTASPSTFLPNGGNNYAVGGATALNWHAGDSYFAQQLGWFKQDHQRIDRHALITLWMTQNDVVSSQHGPFDPQAVSDAYLAHVHALKSMGARNLVAFSSILNLVPDSSFSSPEEKAEFIARESAYSETVKPMLARAGVYIIDNNKLADDVLNNLSKYGFTVGTEGLLCNPGDPTPCDQIPNDGHVFADGHFSSAMHSVIADYAAAQLRARDQFASLLTQPMVAMRQETAGLEARLASNAFLKNNANGQPARRAVGDVQAYAGAAYNRVNNDSTGGFDPGAKGNSTGGYVGADVIAADKLLLGGKLSYSQFDGDFGSRSGDYQRNTTSLSAYGAWQPLAQTTLNFALTYGYLDYNNITRKAQLGSVAHASAKGDTSGDYVAARLGGGYDFALQDWTLTPNAALTYERVKLDGYSEKTSVLAIAYGDSTYNAMRGSLGLNLALTGGTYKVRPYARMSLEHDFRSGDLTVYAGPDKGLLAGYDVTRPDRTFGMGTLGANVALTDRVGLNLNYNQTFQQNHFSAWAANAGLQLDF